MEVPEISKKLGEISFIMGDGYHFMKMRMLMEGIDEKITNATATQVELDVYKMVEQFHRLCKYAEGNPLL